MSRLQFYFSAIMFVAIFDAVYRLLQLDPKTAIADCLCALVCWFMVNDNVKPKRKVK